MSEGELSSKDSDDDVKTGRGTKDSDDASKQSGGRFRAPSSAAVDLPAYAPDDDDEVVDEVAKRFRSGPRLGSPVLRDAESLDQQDAEGDDADEGSVLDALDAPAFEPAMKGMNPAATAEAVPAFSDTRQIALDAETDRLDTDKIDEIPMVDIEPISEIGVDKESDARPVVCPSCHAENPAGMSFCVECGGSLEPPKAASGVGQAKGEAVGVAEVIREPKRQPPPASDAAQKQNPWEIQLVSINEDGTDGKSVPLKFMETTVGRDGDQRFPTDAFLSPKHSRFHIEKGQLHIEDLYSLNGTFIKLRDETRLTPGDTILMGRQVLRFERFEQSITPKTKSSDGTRYMGSPAPGGSFKILQIGIGGVIQNVYCLPEAGAVLGREKGDIVFPHDKFMSGRHAQIYAGDDGHCYLVDLNSSNGTWIKIWEKTKLDDKDFIFMGQQLFRVQYDE